MAKQSAQDKPTEKYRYFLVRTPKNDILFWGTESTAGEIERECRVVVKRSFDRRIQQ